MDNRKEINKKTTASNKNHPQKKEIPQQQINSPLKLDEETLLLKKAQNKAINYYKLANAVVAADKALNGDCIDPTSFDKMLRARAQEINNINNYSGFIDKDGKIRRFIQKLHKQFPQLVNLALKERITELDNLSKTKLEDGMSNSIRQYKETIEKNENIFEVNPLSINDNTTKDNTQQPITIDRDTRNIWTIYEELLNTLEHKQNLKFQQKTTISTTGKQSSIQVEEAEAVVNVNGRVLKAVIRRNKNEKGNKNEPGSYNYAIQLAQYYVDEQDKNKLKIGNPFTDFISVSYINVDGKNIIKAEDTKTHEKIFSTQNINRAHQLDALLATLGITIKNGQPTPIASKESEIQNPQLIMLSTGLGKGGILSTGAMVRDGGIFVTTKDLKKDLSGEIPKFVTDVYGQKIKVTEFPDDFNINEDINDYLEKNKYVVMRHDQLLNYGDKLKNQNIFIDEAHLLNPSQENTNQGTLKNTIKKLTENKNKVCAATATPTEQLTDLFGKPTYKFFLAEAIECGKVHKVLHGEDKVKAVEESPGQNKAKTDEETTKKLSENAVINLLTRVGEVTIDKPGYNKDYPFRFSSQAQGIVFTDDFGAAQKIHDLLSSLKDNTNLSNQLNTKALENFKQFSYTKHDISDNFKNLINSKIINTITLLERALNKPSDINNLSPIIQKTIKFLESLKSLNNLKDFEEIKNAAYAYPGASFDVTKLKNNLDNLKKNLPSKNINIYEDLVATQCEKIAYNIKIDIINMLGYGDIEKLKKLLRNHKYGDYTKNSKDNEDNLNAIFDKALEKAKTLDTEEYNKIAQKINTLKESGSEEEKAYYKALDDILRLYANKTTEQVADDVKPLNELSIVHNLFQDKGGISALLNKKPPTEITEIELEKKEKEIDFKLRKGLLLYPIISAGCGKYLSTGYNNQDLTNGLTTQQHPVASTESLGLFIQQMGRIFRSDDGVCFGTNITLDTLKEDERFISFEKLVSKDFADECAKMQKLIPQREQKRRELLEYLKKLEELKEKRLVTKDKTELEKLNGEIADLIKKIEQQEPQRQQQEPDQKPQGQTRQTQSEHPESVQTKTEPEIVAPETKIETGVGPEQAEQVRYKSIQTQTEPENVLPEITPKKVKTNDMAIQTGSEKKDEGVQTEPENTKTNISQNESQNQIIQNVPNQFNELNESKINSEQYFDLEFDDDLKTKPNLNANLKHIDIGMPLKQPGTHEITTTKHNINATIYRNGIGDNPNIHKYRIEIKTDPKLSKEEQEADKKEFATALYGLDKNINNLQNNNIRAQIITNGDKKILRINYHNPPDNEATVLNMVSKLLNENLGEKFNITIGFDNKLTEQLNELLKNDKIQQPNPQSPLSVKQEDNEDNREQQKPGAPITKGVKQLPKRGGLQTDFKKSYSLSNLDNSKIASKNNKKTQSLTDLDKKPSNSA